MNALILATALLGAPADYVLIEPTPVVAYDYVLIVRPTRSVVVRRTVVPVAPVIRRTYVVPPRIIRYYEPTIVYPPTYVPDGGSMYCPTCR